MRLALTEDQELIRSAARELLDSRTPAWKEMADLGWTGLAVPEEHGGLGTGFLELCLLVEELGRAGVASPLLATAACCGMTIASCGTDAQRAELLPAIARGGVMTYGSGPTLSAGKIAGTAMFVPYADVAAEILVVTGQPACLVSLESAGITVDPQETVGPDPLFRVAFSDVPVGHVFKDAGEAVSAYGTAATCASMAGGAQRVLDMTVAYARQREAFGSPIGSFQAVQHHCANMAIDVLTSRYITYEAIWRLSAGLDARGEISMAKAWTSEAYERVCALGHQVHGAIGFTAEHELHRFSGHAMAYSVTFGDADDHWQHVARHIGL